MSAAVITVPAFASARDGVRHFFGTRRHADSLAFDVGVPARQSGAQGRGWLLSVKQVHGTEALVVDRPLIESDQFHRRVGRAGDRSTRRDGGGAHGGLCPRARA